MSENSLLFGIDYDKPKRKIVGPIHFEKMLPKKAITDDSMLIRYK
jgi:hypothetical protein